MTNQMLNKNEGNINIKPKNNIKRKQIILYSAILSVLIALLIVGIIYSSNKNSNNEAEAMGIYTHTKEGSEATDKLLEYKSNMEVIVEPTDGTMIDLALGSSNLITFYQDYSEHIIKTIYNPELINSPAWNDKMLKLLATVIVRQEALHYDGVDDDVTYELALLDEKVKATTGIAIELVATKDVYVAEELINSSNEVGRAIIKATTEIMKDYKTDN